MAVPIAKRLCTPLLAGLGAVLFALLTLATLPASAEERDVDMDVLYQALEPYGVWLEHPIWGSVWQPNVDADWRPYANGSWIATDPYGWYWEAEEPWGWITFHYGRWLLQETGIWIWIPDGDWGPAWVAWRASEEYVGWVALPPRLEAEADGEPGFAADVLSEPAYLVAWVFVRPHQLLLSRLYRYVASRRQTEALFRQTRPLRRMDGAVGNPGFDVKRLERMLGRPIVRLKVKTADSLQEANVGQARRPGADLLVYRPRFLAAEGGRIRRPPPAVTPEAPGAGGGGGLEPKGGPGRPAEATAQPGPEPRQAPSRADGKGRRPPSPAAAAIPTRPGYAGRAFAPADAVGGNRQRSPTPAPMTGELGKGPPPGLKGRSGVPQRLETGPRPTARPPPAPLGQGQPPAGFRAPSVVPTPRPPASDGRRGPPRREDARGPG
jgi:hypothetical protein